MLVLSTVVSTTILSALAVIPEPPITLSVGVPEVPPPVRPVPAVTPVMSPTLAVAPAAMPSSLVPSVATSRPSTVPDTVMFPGELIYQHYQ